MNDEKNKFALTCLKVVSETIKKKKAPIYNPIFISGLIDIDRYNIFKSLFDLSDIEIIDCKKDNSKLDVDNQKVLIIENIDVITNDFAYQKRIVNIINESLDKNIQLIICSNLNLQALKLEEKLKSRLSWGISLYLE